MDFTIPPYHDPLQYTQAALSLQTAAAKYITKKASDPRMLSPKVVLASSCEVDVDCRHVLYETFVEKGKGGAREHCIFADVLKTDRADKRAFCVVHNKLCPLLPAKEKDRILTLPTCFAWYVDDTWCQLFENSNHHVSWKSLCRFLRNPGQCLWIQS